MTTPSISSRLRIAGFTSRADAKYNATTDLARTIARIEASKASEATTRVFRRNP